MVAVVVAVTGEIVPLAHVRPERETTTLAIAIGVVPAFAVLVPTLQSECHLGVRSLWQIDRQTWYVNRGFDSR